MTCPVCADAGVVCENHRDRPWLHDSHAENACGCGAGVLCPVCGVEIGAEDTIPCRDVPCPIQPGAGAEPVTRSAENQGDAVGRTAGSIPATGASLLGRLRAVKRCEGGCHPSSCLCALCEEAAEAIEGWVISAAKRASADPSDVQ